MSEYKFVCESCRNSYDYEVRTELFGASLCPECYHTMISIMNYKNYKDIPEEEKVMLQKVLNKIVKNHLTNRSK